MRQIKELSEVFQRNVKAAHPEELLRWRVDLPTYFRKFDKIADDFKEVLKSPITNADKLYDIRTIGVRYESLSDLKQTFSKLLEKQIEDQEIDKQGSLTKHNST